MRRVVGLDDFGRGGSRLAFRRVELGESNEFSTRVYGKPRAGTASSRSVDERLRRYTFAMPPKAAPSRPIRDALDGSAPLALLKQRMQASQARFDAVAPLFAEPMRALVRPGPLDDDGWTLLAPNGAVAAKLRQLLPALQHRLDDDGWPRVALRVRVLAPD
jgi:hypothetical protein